MMIPGLKSSYRQRRRRHWLMAASIRDNDRSSSGSEIAVLVEDDVPTVRLSTPWDRRRSFVKALMRHSSLWAPWFEGLGRSRRARDQRHRLHGR